MIGGEREVVRLSLGDGMPTLNVLPVGLEGDTLTLVCPFPVLPIEVPVTVTLPWQGGVEPVTAMIRRVSVEMVGDTGLPRFKLRLALDPSVLPDEDYDLVDDEVVNEREAGGGPGEAGTEGSEPERFDEVDAGGMSWGAGDLFRSRPRTEIEADQTDRSARSWSGLPSSRRDLDPPWTGLPDAKEVGDARGSATRRRRWRWPVRTAVSLALLVSVFAVGYVMREEIAAASSPIIGEELTLASLGLAQRAAPAEPAPEPAAAPAPAEPAAPEPAAEPAPAEPVAPEPAEPEIGAALEADGLEEAAAAPPAPDPSVVEAEDQLRVMLPTRFPVTEARSYRLNNPSGIVVDVPGGAASERARWIETAHERIRSVRVLEREDGVRFIIYLNDETVPRYRVGYTRTGVTVDILGPDPRHVASK